MTSHSNVRTKKEISSYVSFLSRLNRIDKIRELMVWKRYADGSELTRMNASCYFLPLTRTAGKYDEPNPDNSLMICKNAMLAILGKGSRFWKTCCKAARDNILPIHGMTGKISNSAPDPESDVYQSLFLFFEDMKELAEPRATRLVRELTNNGVRDDNDTLDLPAWTTKRELYRRWCFEQGWKMRTTDMGNWTRIPRQDYEGKL
jgi:hypothetical protein